MEKWKAKYASHFPTPSTATRYLQKSMRYTNNPTGTKDRALHLLCLLALHMDANRAYDVYINQESSKVDRFLGSDTWKIEFANSGRPRHEFPRFLAEYFASRMQTLGFEETPTHSMHLV